MSLRKRMLADLDQEIREHIEIETQDNIECGMSPEEARHAAMRKFGNVAKIKDQTYEVWVVAWLESILGDLKYAVRQLAKSPGITLVAIATLALGIGASAAIFTLTSAIVLNSLPVPNPERLISYDLRDGDRMRGVSGPFYTLLRQRQKTSIDLMTWTNLAWMKDEKISVRFASQSSLEDIQFFSVNSFRVLELQPFLGRGFSGKDEDAPVMPVIVSYDYWHTNLAADPDVLGKTLTIVDQPVTIIGVMPRGFDGLTAGLHPAVYLPLFATKIFLSKDETTAAWPSHSGFYVLGRLKPGVTLKQAAVEARTLEPSLRKDADPTGIYYAQFFKALRLSVRDGSSGFSWLKTTYASPLVVLELLVALFLILCAVNTALVMLARVSGRQREYAVRVALGALHHRIVRQVLVETFLLAVPGLVLGVLLGWFGAHALGSMLASDGLSEQLDLKPNALILSVTAAVTLLLALCAAAVPACRAAKTSPAFDLKASAHNVASGNLGGWAIALQVTVSLCLVSVALMFGATLTQLLTTHSGFHFENVASADIDLSPLKLSDEEGNKVFQRFATTLESQPSVSAAAFVSPFPLYGHYTVSRAFSFDKQHQVHSQPSMSFVSITPGYFRAAGTRLVAGDPKPEATRDDKGTPNCVISQSLVQFFFPGEDPLGQLVYFSTLGKPDGTAVDPKNACRIISVAEDAKYVSLRRPPPVILYQLIRLNVITDYAPTNEGEVLVRAASNSLGLAAIRDAAAETLPTGSIVKAQTFTDRVNQDLSRERMLVLLAASFALLALLLTALGLYGLLMRSVNLRVREIGIRVALGAQRTAILMALVEKTLINIAIGLSAGTAGAVFLAQAIHRLLDIHSMSGIAGYLVSALLILVIALLAVIPPARQAGRIDPMQALRSE